MKKKRTSKGNAEQRRKRTERARAAKLAKASRLAAPWRTGEGDPLDNVYSLAELGVDFPDIIDELDLAPRLADENFRQQVQHRFKRGRARYHVNVQLQLSKAAREGKSNAIRLEAEAVLQKFKEGESELQRVVHDAESLHVKIKEILTRLRDENHRHCQENTQRLSPKEST